MALVSSASHSEASDPGNVRLPAAGRRLVVVSPTFAPEPLGTPLYATDTVTWLAAAGWEVEVVTAQPFYPQFKRYEGYGRARRRDQVGGASVRRLPTIVPRGGHPGWRLASDANFLVQGVVRARTGVVQRAPTVLSISPGSPVAPLVGAAATSRGGRHVCLVHDVQSGLATGLGMVRNGRAVDAMRAAERWSIDRADQVLTLSEEMRDVLTSMGVSSPIEVLPLWSTVVPDSTIIPQAPITDIQFSGNFGRKQGLEQLAALLARLRQVRPQTTFRLRGAGPLRDAFQAQLRDAGLEVEIEPPVNSADLPGALMSSRIHVVPQLAATAAHVVPSKIVNALAMGGAVVAFSNADSPVARMAANCDAIRVVPVGDIEAGVREACSLLDHRDPGALRASAAAYAAAAHDRDTLLRRLHAALAGPRV